MTDPPHAKLGDVKPSYCILVSSCDAYADCWLPFFTLLATYWQPCNHEIYLNTETQPFSFPGLDIHCPRVGLAISHDLTWSERLLRCLDSIPHEIVLYLQEDYFINDIVNISMIDQLVELMQRDHLSHVSLARSSKLKPGQKSSYQFLSHIDQRAEYRISAQAGLWRVSALRSYLRRHETVWEFEWYGTRRARRKKDTFFYVNEEYQKAHGKMVVPYVGTGVVHGRWARKVVVELFAKHRISVDYTLRGFHDEVDGRYPRAPMLTRAARRLRSLF